MRQLIATVRRSPSALVGILVALTAAAAVVTIAASMMGTAQTMKAPVARLAASPVIVLGDEHVRITSGHGDNSNTTSLPLTDYRRVPTDLAGRLQRLPGVARVVTDVSVPLSLQGTGGAAAQVTGHGWQSAALTPFRVVAGHVPEGPWQVVLSADVARSLRTGVGGLLRLAGRDLPPFSVVGLAAPPTGHHVARPAAFFADAVAARLYGHPGQADLLAILPTGRTSDTSSLAAAIRRAAHTALGANSATAAGPGVTVLTGDDRGLAEDVGAVGNKDNLNDYAAGAGIPVVMVSLFVVAGAVGLSVAGRRRHFALLRAVGATSGQIRRSIAGELAVLGIAGGVLGYPLGTWLAGVAVDGMIRHDLVPSGTMRWTAWWVLLVACGAGLVVAQLAGFAAGWRAGRVDPVLALREATADRRRPNPVRLLFGIAALGGGVTLAIVTFHEAHNPIDEINMALGTLLAFVAAVGLLGPILVSLAELAIRVPARALGGPGARLALADIRCRPRRIASAVVAVALSVGFLGTVYLVNANAVHADETQGHDRLAADSVVAAPAGLSPRAVPAIATLPGVTSTLGVTSTTVFLPNDGGFSVAGAALTSGDIARVLRLGVVSGRLDHIRPGQIALSQLAADKTKVGSTVSVYLADGTPYRARVVAIFNRGLGFGDVVVPIDAAGGGHLGTTTVGQVLIRGRAPARDMTQLASRFPGITVQGRAAANAEAKRIDDQSQYLNTLIVVLIAMLAAVTLVNTMVTATLERRDSLHLLDRVGATWRQLMSMACWQTAVVGAIGMLCGVASGAAALIAVTKALTGHWLPYIPATAATGLGIGIVALTAAAVLGPTATLLRPKPVPGE